MTPFIAMLAIAAASPVQPLGDPQQWVTPDDYPPAALRAQAEGIVRVALSIDAAGNLTNCRVDQSSGNADLDAATCALLMRRAKFTPAHDASGRAIASRALQRFHWEIPRDPLTSRASRATFSLARDGHIKGCKTAEVGGHDPNMTCNPQGVENVARSQLSNPLNHYRSIALMLALEVGESPEVSALRSASGEDKVLARSIHRIAGGDHHRLRCGTNSPGRGPDDEYVREHFQDRNEGIRAFSRTSTAKGDGQHGADRRATLNRVWAL